MIEEKELMIDMKVKKKYARRKEYTRRKLGRANFARKGKWIRNFSWKGKG